jgi:hypothetical protein
MIDVAELSPEYVLKLPAAVASRFRASDRFIVWTEGDTVVLKRITPPSVTDVVAQSPQAEPMTDDEINTIVHEVRRRRRAG